MKRKRLEGFTQASLKASSKKVEEVWKKQQGERRGLGEGYQRQVLAVIAQWETDVVKSKEAEEKLQGVIKQQQKLFQQQRVVQTQRLKTIKQLHEQYSKVCSPCCISIVGGGGGGTPVSDTFLQTDLCITISSLLS